MHRVALRILAIFGTVVFAATNVSAQCIISNPSFEISGSGGQEFAGWNQFGVVGSTSNAPHGAAAARVTGPNLGGWDVSSCWQAFDTAPGERWEATVKAWHTTVNPLTGQSKAILNIEWRDSGGSIISFETHDVATAATPQDEIQEFNVVSGPAPTGAVKTRLLLAIIQEPGAPTPDVYYDLAQFDEIGPPSIDDIQWDDFPGGRTISFSGYDWRVKGPGIFGPGPNRFDDRVDAVWVDGGQLHMTVKNNFGNWFSTEVALVDPLGYGDYIFTTVGQLDLLDPNVVFGLFVWQYGACYDPAQVWWNPYNEFDIEFSRWGSPGNEIGQFVAQPFDWPGNLSRFDATFSSGEITSHAFRWLPDRVECRSWRGGPQDESTSVQIHSWTYTGPHIPRPEQPRVHINLWQINTPASNQEVVLDEFTFVPAGGPTGVADERKIPARSFLADARPNPFNPTTTIGYTMVTDGFAEIVIYDVRGRSVRTLVTGNAGAGTNEVTWDGRDDSGTRVASGVYLYQLRTGSAVETKKMVMLK